MERLTNKQAVAVLLGLLLMMVTGVTLLIVGIVYHDVVDIVLGAILSIGIITDLIFRWTSKLSK
jgi:hypothetical protein